MTAQVTTGPLTLELPDWMDTNETYKLVTPSGDSYDVVYDLIEARWCVLPF